MTTEPQWNGSCCMLDARTWKDAVFATRKESARRCIPVRTCWVRDMATAHSVIEALAHEGQLVPMVSIDALTVVCGMELRINRTIPEDVFAIGPHTLDPNKTVACLLFDGRSSLQRKLEDEVK